VSTELGPRERAAATKRKRTISATTAAARILFDAHGWDGTTVDDIAKEAGVSTPTITRYFATKRDLALGAYASDLTLIVEQAEAPIINGGVYGILIGFIYGLTDITTEHPALAIALLSTCRDFKSGDTAAREGEITVVDFDQLTEPFGRLIGTYWNGKRPSVSPITEVAEFYLSGLLSWILKHPDRSSEDAAELTLSQLL
jgi:AcrR family transcriptional regulator